MTVYHRDGSGFYCWQTGGRNRDGSKCMRWIRGGSESSRCPHHRGQLTAEERAAAEADVLARMARVHPARPAADLERDLLGLVGRTLALQRRAATARGWTAQQRATAEYDLRDLEDRRRRCARAYIRAAEREAAEGVTQ